MTPRHMILVISSVALLAAGLYLFKEVRATPATADVSKRPERHAAPDEPAAEEAKARTPENVPERSPTRRTLPPSEAIPLPQTPQPERSPNVATLNTGDPAPAIESVADELAKPNPRMDAVMAEANKSYDHGDFDEAKGIALKVLAKDPTNVRMLRIAVSAACIDGDSAEAQKHYTNLPPGDREQMKVRCARYGVTFNDK